MCDLAVRVDPGIGAAGAGEADRFIRHAPQGTLGHLLQRRHGRLRLPAGVGAAIVFDANGDSQQRIPLGTAGESHAFRRRQRS
jgi:hypothetical protein